MAQRLMSNYTCTLSEEDMDKAKRELTEDPETRKLEIQTLRERLLRYPGLTPRVDDVFLLKFLRPRKFDQERTFALVLDYYKIKKNNEDIYAEMTPKAVRRFLDQEIVSVIPHGGKEGETILLTKAARWDTDTASAEDMYKANFIIMSAIIESEAAQVNGVRFIYDLEGFGWHHLKTITPGIAQKFVSIVQDKFPARVKAIHHVNEHSIFDFFFAIVRPLFKEKLVKRLFFHGTKYEELHDYIHQDLLPVEYGGKQPSFFNKEFNKRLLEKQEEFEDDAKFGFVSMTIKEESKKSADAMEKLPGTFKKLNVD